MGVLEEYHAALGDLIFRFEGTLERFAGDGLMVFFNDPVRCDDGPARAIRMSVAMRTRVRGLAESWARQGHDLALGIGIAQGYATLGRIGFDGRHDYAAIGSVTNLASRLCADAEPWQILVTERVFSAAGPLVVGEDAGTRELRGFSRSVHAFDVKGIDNARSRVMTGDLWTPPAAVGADVLSKLDEDERYRRFDELQARMGEVWDAMRLNHDDESVVVVPSITLDRAVASSGSMTQSYEERFLFLLMLLRQPRLRMVYVTSMPIAPEIIEYYLALLPGVIPSHARSRLSLVAVHDASPRSLSEKLLERPHLLARIAALIPNRSRSHLVPYNTTELERDVALSLGIPMYGADPRLAPLGSKTGCRRMFAEVGVPHPLGVENLRTPRRPGRRGGRDAGASGPDGQRHRQAQRGRLRGGQRPRPAVGGLPAPGSADERRRRPRAAAGHGAGVADDAPSTSTSPSSRRAPASSRSGSSGRRSAARASSCGCCPAATSSCCRPTTSCSEERAGRATWAARSRRHRSTPARSREHAETIGRRLADQGALGRFAVDFVVVRDTDGAWTPYAIELNLRKGGTTHPFLTLQFLTDGRYDPATALFLTPRGHEKHLVATDHLESGLLRGLTLVRPVRHRGPPRAALRPVAAGRDRVPHDQLPHRARPDRPHRRRRHAGRGGPALSRGRAGPAGGGAAGPRGMPAAGLRCVTAADLVRRLRLQPGDGTVPLLPVRRAPGRRLARLRRLPRPERPHADRGRRGAGWSRVRRGVARVGRRHGVLRPHRDRGVAGCAYLVTTEQFADVAAQELRRPPGGEFAARPERAPARRGVRGHHGARSLRDGGPARRARRRRRCSRSPTTTSRACVPAAPTAAYLRWISSGCASRTPTTTPGSPATSPPPRGSGVPGPRPRSSPWPRPDHAVA